MKRFCVWLAHQLTRRTACAVVRADYIARSGGLQDPRRIKAYRHVLRASFDVRNSAQAVLVK